MNKKEKELLKTVADHLTNSLADTTEKQAGFPVNDRESIAYALGLIRGYLDSEN